uniref:Fibrinogen C-terminal domain-containing protein n=1 Tax=Dicentrarchus labrax TaxID=13489 RepID=A0A8C4DYE0_DICLA
MNNVKIYSFYYYIFSEHQTDPHQQSISLSRNLTMKLVSVLLLLLAPMLTSCQQLVQPVDCSDVHLQDKSQPSGVYTIYPAGERSAVQVYCDMDSEGGRWTVFQRRMDGSVNFYRPWDQYKFGFGSAAGEYWLGLDNIYYLTHNRKIELLVDMEDFEGKKVFARWSLFSIDAECDGYRLHVSGFTNGGAGDSLSGHSGHKFSTFDKDQDTWPDNCAKNSWVPSGTVVVTVPTPTGFIVGGLTRLSMLLEWTGLHGRVMTTP